MPARPNLLVLCTGNSCRSQIAQAYLNRYAGSRFEAYSAGTEPAAEVHPMTLQVLEEEGFDTSGLAPVHLSEYLGILPVHTLVIVCDGAAKACPAIWPGIHQRLSWPFEDPAVFEGSEEETLEKFRTVRDAIQEKVIHWAQEQGLGEAV